MQRKKVWEVHENVPVRSGTAVTAGDIGFYGTMDRWFKAVDAKTGAVLWSIRTLSGIIGQPVTYVGADGLQYAAIMSGVGGWSGAVAVAELDPRIRNGASPAARRRPAGTAVPARRAGAVRLARARSFVFSGAALFLALAASGAGTAMADPAQLRVCADPNNLPFSNAAGEGFENNLAELVARDLGREVAYTWWAQRRGNVRNTLKAEVCDVIMGVPAALDMVLATRPYYRSTYVFVSRADRDLKLASMTDPRLRELAIGVHLIGDDGFNTPPAHALGAEGIVDNVTGFPIYGNYSNPNPPARLIEAVETGKVDVAAAWGPLAGYVALHSPVALNVVPIRDTASFAPFAFQYDIAMGVRKGDRALKAELDGVIERRSADIAQLLNGDTGARLP